MFKLTIKRRNLPFLESNTIPADDTIVQIVEHWFSNFTTDNPMEKELLSLLESSLLKSLPIKFDYRNNNLVKEQDILKDIVLRSGCNKFLLEPLKEILLVSCNMTNPSRSVENYNRILESSSGILDDSVDVVTEYLQESEVMDFALVLSMKKYIPARLLESYLSREVELVYKEAQDSIIGKLISDRKNTEVRTIPNDITYLQESFPNEDMLDTVMEFYTNLEKTSPDNMQLILLDEDLDTFVSDFLSDENFASIPGNAQVVYQTLSDFVNDIYTNRRDTSKYRDLLCNMKEFHAAYVRYYIKMLHYVAVIVIMILDKMIELCEVEKLRAELIQFKNNFFYDIKNYRDNRTTFDHGTEEIFGKIIAMWQFPSDTKIGRKLLAGYRSNDDDFLFGLDIPENEEVVTESGGYYPSSFKLTRALTESFEVLQDGTIKVTIERKSTYMDEYATNHRLLMANRKIGNYEGMKYNLVYDLILIDSIEKNVIYNTKVKKGSMLYEDAAKARSFAKNDVSTYLPEIRKHSKNWDINAFYKKVNADRNTITIDGPATAAGVKKIFKYIL